MTRLFVLVCQGGPWTRSTGEARRGQAWSGSRGGGQRGGPCSYLGRGALFSVLKVGFGFASLCTADLFLKSCLRASLC